MDIDITGYTSLYTRACTVREAVYGWSVQFIDGVSSLWMECPVYGWSIQFIDGVSSLLMFSHCWDLMVAANIENAH